MESKSEPACRQSAASALPEGWQLQEASAPIRKWVRLLRLEEAALHQDVKRQSSSFAFHWWHVFLWGSGSGC